MFLLHKNWALLFLTGLFVLKKYSIMFPRLRNETGGPPVTAETRRPPTYPHTRARVYALNI